MVAIAEQREQVENHQQNIGSQIDICQVSHVLIHQRANCPY